MKIHGFYIVIGEKFAPVVRFLDDNAHVRFQQTMEVACNTSQPERYVREVLDTTFGKGAEAAFPAWNENALAFLFTEYEGAHADDLKWLVARIFQGLPYGDEAKAERDAGKGDGGTTIRAEHTKPKKPRPGSGTSVKQPMVAGARA